jgi:NaMN:DMB phosphoribosyltransferase
MRRTTASLAVVAALGGAVLLAAAEGPKPKEDDLALVKRAVALKAVAQNQGVSAPARPQAEVKPAPRATVRDHDPQWFKVRVVDKATGKRKVTVNLPLAVVRALGDDMPIDWPCGGRDSRVRSSIKLSEVLATLEAGQDLVQVDDDDSEVRVWVE